jgi:hypothetical protein
MLMWDLSCSLIVWFQQLYITLVCCTYITCKADFQTDECYLFQGFGRCVEGKQNNTLQLVWTVVSVLWVAWADTKTIINKLKWSTRRFDSPHARTCMPRRAHRICCWLVQLNSFMVAQHPPPMHPIFRFCVSYAHSATFTANFGGERDVSLSSW